MNDEHGFDPAARARLIAALSELIAALDRRVPQVERLGERRIARDAAVLRQEAAVRLEHLKNPSCQSHLREARRA